MDKVCILSLLGFFARVMLHYITYTKSTAIHIESCHYQKTAKYSQMNILLNSQFRNIDLFMDEIREWELDFKILVPGGFEANVVQLYSNDVLISYAKFNSSIHQEGVTPLGYRTFVVIGPNCDGFWWLGQHVAKNDLLVFPNSNELYAVTTEDFEVYTISIKTVLYDEMLNDLKLDPLNKSQMVIPLESFMADSLRNTLGNILSNYSHVSQHYLKQYLVKKLIDCTTKNTKELIQTRKRDQSINTVIEYVRNLPPEHVPDVSELCMIGSVSERTLQYAFNERYQMSPVEFIRAWRLNKAHRILARSEKESIKVSTIARKLGFHHLGQFSAYYKHLFAELPSETLSRKF